MDFQTLVRLARKRVRRDKAKLLYNRLKETKITEQKVVESSCWIPANQNGTPLGCNSSGYVQKVIIQPSGHDNRQRIHGKRITAYVHQLGWWRRRHFRKTDVRVMRLKVLNGQSMTISHLCHNKRCFRSGHLTAEPRWVNVYRDRCRLLRRVGDCRCHCSRLGVPDTYKHCLTPL